MLFPFILRSFFSQNRIPQKKMNITPKLLAAVTCPGIFCVMVSHFKIQFWMSGILSLILPFLLPPEACVALLLLGIFSTLPALGSYFVEVAASAIAVFQGATLFIFKSVGLGIALVMTVTFLIQLFQN